MYSLLAKRRTMRLFSFTTMVAVAWVSFRHNLKDVQILGVRMQPTDLNRGLTTGGNNYRSSSSSSSGHREMMELQARLLETEAQLTKRQQELEAAKQELQHATKQVATMEERDNYSSVCLMIMDANHEIM